MYKIFSIGDNYLTTNRAKAYHVTMIMDIHIHTHFSPCSIIKIPKLLCRAREIGLDGICITDHDTIASKPVVEDIANKSEICVIVGLEYTTSDGDFLVFGPVDYIPRDMRAEELYRWVKKEGGVIIPAHPFRSSRPVTLNILQYSEIIEMLNGRNHSSENESCRNWISKQQNRIKEVGGSDAHTIEEVGKIATVFEKDIYNSDDFIRELQHGNYLTAAYESLQMISA
ncbi:MAG: PHP domain-containing protein [Nitrospirae bacterium]|nr:PHP domain-containing protein [Nitrospirota bacterium]